MDADASGVASRGSGIGAASGSVRVGVAVADATGDDAWRSIACRWLWLRRQPFFRDGWTQVRLGVGGEGGR